VGDISISVSRSDDDDVAIIGVVGYVDLSTVPELKAALERHDAPVLRVDLSGVSFLDSSGLQVLLAAHKRARDGGRRLVLVAPSPTVRRLFEITGLDGELDVDDDHD
jgi:anti-sigma B factor antagonist